MSREWKPGDVALVNDTTRPEAPWKVAMCTESAVRGICETRWRIDTGEVWGSVSQARPLVTIDAEDESGDLSRLWRLLPDNLVSVDQLQAALREYANPKPPRIDEPGTWAVVEASCVHDDTPRRWVKFPGGNWHTQVTFGQHRSIDNPDDWDSLIDPVLVRDGVDQ